LGPKVLAVRIPIRDGLLQPGPDPGGVGERFFRKKTVHFIAQADGYADVPEPANADVDFAIVDSLEFGREIATAVSDRLQDSAESPDRKSSSASRHAPASLFP